MTKLLLAFLLLFSLSCGRVNVQKSLHSIRMETEDDAFRCSSYSVGQHSLITASHCFPSGVLKVQLDGNDFPILDKIEDGNDHTILISSYTFSDYIKFDPVMPEVGDRVYSYSNPSSIELFNQYKEGYVSGFHVTSEGDHLIMFQMNSVGGDSGSLIFNDKDQVVGMPFTSVSSYTASMQFKFTPEQLKQIK